MKCIIGRKLEMTQVFREDGTVVPVTLILAGPCTITALRTPDRDGYTAVQMGFGDQKPQRVARAQAGAWGDLGSFQVTREFRVDDGTAFEVGSKLDVSQFTIGEKVQATGLSKGRGFQGPVKRHGFHGSDMTHGNKDQQRMSGSIGAKGPAKVFKGTRMAGRMGGDRVTVKNLEVVEVRSGNILAIKGAVPGSRNSLVLIQA